MSLCESLDLIRKFDTSCSKVKGNVVNIIYKKLQGTLWKNECFQILLNVNQIFVIENIEINDLSAVSHAKYIFSDRH